MTGPVTPAAPSGLQAEMVERRFTGEAPAHADHTRGAPDDGPGDWRVPVMRPCEQVAPPVNQEPAP